MMPAVAAQHKEPTAADVAEPVALGALGNTSECVRDLIRKSQRVLRLRALVEDGFFSGPASEDTQTDRDAQRGWGHGYGQADASLATRTECT